jgi:hypothetical protein
MTTQSDRSPWLGRLTGFTRARQQQVEPAAKSPAYRAPSPQNRKSLVSWQDEAAIKELKRLAVELGTTQQALIAEGINLVLAKHRKATVAAYEAPSRSREILRLVGHRVSRGRRIGRLDGASRETYVDEDRAQQHSLR